MKTMVLCITRFILGPKKGISARAILCVVAVR